MRKNIIFIALTAFLVLFITGCKIVKKVEDYTIDLSGLPEEVTLENFDINDIKLLVKYNTKETEEITLDDSMMSEEDLAKLNTIGNHQIFVTYENIIKAFNIEICTIKYKVTFLDFEGNILNEQYVEKWESAVVPEYPLVEGYEFIGFDSDSYIYVSDNVVIRPIYERNVFIVRFINQGVIVEERTMTKGQRIRDLPDIPYVEGYIGEWNIEEGVKVESDLEIDLTYKMDENYISLKEAYDSLITKYSNKLIESNIEFEQQVGQNFVTWETNSEYLSNDGKLKRPYERTEIAIDFTITNTLYEMKGTIPVIIDGYKSLDGNIASGYVYRSYEALDDQFFETMDIIYCAFILFNGSGTFGNNVTVLSRIKNYVIPKSQENGIYAVLSLGGGGAGPRDSYVAMTKDPECRKKLISNIIDLINEYGFSGVDIDWETPTTEQAPYFTTFVKELNEAVKKNNPNHLITAAITGGKWQPNKYDLNNSGQYLDYINVMTYGMTSNGGQYQNALYPRSGYNDSTNKVGATLGSCSIQESVTIFNNYGIPNSKLIFGLAFYGIKQEKKNGSWQSGNSVYYTSIKNDYLNNDNYNYHYDEVAQVPYLLSADKTIFISFDDPRSIKAKCEFVKNTKCAGVMYWENGCDLTGDLVNAIYEGLKK